MCHGVGHCVKMRVFTIKPGLKVNLSQQMSDVIKRFADDNLSFTNTVYPAFNTVQLLHCKTLNFLSPELRPVTVHSLTPLTTPLGLGDGKASGGLWPVKQI